MAARDSDLSQDDLFDNPTTRVPVCLILDMSASMANPHAGETQTPIEALNEGVELFFRSVEADEVARYAADIAVVAFSDKATTIQDFGPVTRTPPRLTATGPATSLGSGVRMGLDLVNRRKAQFQALGVEYFQPWLVIMTDGYPTDETHKSVATEVADLARQKRLSVFPIGIGAGADLQVLGLFSPINGPLRLKGLAFGSFFQWLGKSVSDTSRSMPGDMKLDTSGIRGWAEL